MTINTTFARVTRFVAGRADVRVQFFAKYFMGRACRAGNVVACTFQNVLALMLPA